MSSERRVASKSFCFNGIARTALAAVMALLLLAAAPQSGAASDKSPEDLAAMAALAFQGPAVSWEEARAAALANASEIGVAAVINVDPTIADGQPGSLREAIDAANSNSEDDLVLVGPGAFVIDILGVDDSNTSGDLDLTEVGFMTTIVGAGTDQTFIDGNAIDRVFHVQRGTSVTLMSMTIRNGAVSGNGGGILNNGYLVLVDCVITTNTATNAGGGLANLEAQVVIENCVISSNWAGSWGGGIESDIGTNSLKMQNSHVVNNNATLGGGLDFAGNGSFVISDSTISGNTARSSSGGGIWAGNSQNSLIINSTISGNMTFLQGGGLRNDGSGSSNIVDVVNCTITNNHATSNGGGVNDNIGGLSYHFYNTIIAGNTNNSGLFPDIASTLVSNGHNLIGNVGDFNFTGNTTGDQYGDPNNTTSENAGAIESATAIDPLLGPLADNGGPTWSHLPQEGSPALNAGDPAFDPNTFSPPLDNDQRGAGFSRVQEGRVEIGAIETIWIDLAIDKSVDDDKVNIGQVVEFTIVLENLSTGTATNIIVTDNLPAEMSYVSDSPSAGTYDSGTDEWTVPSLGPLGSETLLLYASVDEGTTPGLLLENVVVITSANEPDPDDSNNSDLVRFTVNTPPLAGCKDIIIQTDQCELNYEAVDVDNGSFDPDGTIVDMTLTPAGPYPIGDTLVTLTVTDDDGATATCQALIRLLFDVRCELDPPFAQNEVGTSHTVSVTVFVNDVPTSGIEVFFNIVSGPNAGFLNSAITDGSGTANVNYTSLGGVGTDTIATSGTLCGVSFYCEAEKEWVDTSPTPTPTPTPTVTPTPTPTPTPTATPEPTLCNPNTYTFEGTDDGWVTGNATPTLATTTFGQTASALTISGGDFYTFGYWLSPTAAIPSADSGSLYAVRYMLAWDGDPCEMPPLRLRAIADNFGQMEIMGINSLGDCSYAADATPSPYTMHFIPQEGGIGQDFRVALDMLHFDPGDSSSGIVDIESVEIYCFPVSELELTPVRTYDFDTDPEGWTSGTAMLLTPPDFGHLPGGIRMDSTSNVTGFGFWQSPVDDITSLAGQAIVTTFLLLPDVDTPGGSIRVRMFNEDYQGFRYSEFPISPLLDNVEGGGGGVNYISVWEPPYLSAPLDGIGLAFDLINFNPASPQTYGAILDTATVQTTGVPALPPAP